MILYADPPVAVDVSIVNTSAHSYRNCKPTDTLEHACKEKEKKHKPTKINIAGKMKPFVVSTHGQYQSVALDLIGLIAGKAVENGVAYKSSEVVNELKAI